MTKARPRRSRTETEIDDLSWRFLCDAITPEDKEKRGWRLIDLEFNDMQFSEPPEKSTSDLWSEFGDDVLAWWIKDRPGTRPWCWWKLSAPEPRLRVGGVGVTKFSWNEDYEQYLPDFKLPRPSCFLTLDEKRYHPFADNPLAVPVDPNDLPQFESQAAYLRRLKLFLAGEEKRLKPVAFEPETVRPARSGSPEDDFHHRFRKPRREPSTSFGR
jgi:hypothetical protein